METLSNSFVISRTPFRISFVGGGTDYPSWYKDNPSAVLATSINRYCYIMVRWLPSFFEYKYLVSYSEIERVQDKIEIRHPAVRETLKFLDMNEGIDLHHAGDLPARAGMGTSSSFTVGLLNALYTLKGMVAPKLKLASESIYIEQNMMREWVGCQDQTIASFGGFNRIDFAFDAGNPPIPYISVKPLKGKGVEQLESHLLLFFTGLSRTASTVAKEQIERVRINRQVLMEMYKMVGEGEKLLKSCDMLGFGCLLNEAWQLKRTLSPNISTDYMDFLYGKAIKTGAVGGKLLGAGGGGFLLFLVEPDKQPTVRKALSSLLYVPFKLENEGSRIIYGGRFNKES